MSRVRSPYWPIFFNAIFRIYYLNILKGRRADIEFIPVFGFVLVTLFVMVLAMALATVLVTALVMPTVTVAEYCDLNMKNFEFFDFFLVWVFDDERPTVPF